MSTSISISTRINQALLESYTFPVTIEGGTLENPVIITFEEDLIIRSNIEIDGTTKYFILGSEYITVNGESNTVTITDIPDYPGLIQNGTDILTAQTNIRIENIGILSTNETTLLSSGGWVCQQYFGSTINNGTLIINNCYSTGNISGNVSGGICGAYYGYKISEKAELIIQNCYSIGNMIAENGGGICGGGCGYEDTGGKIEINNCYSTGIISGIFNGGICGTEIGNNAKGGLISFTNCYSTGAISGQDCGGIVSDACGYLSSNIIININNCYSVGNISESSGGIVGSKCGLESTNLLVNVNNCYTIGTFDIIIDNGIFGPDKITGTQTNCIASNNNNWSDNDATSTIYVNQPNTWINTDINLPWLLESNNAVLMNITSELVSPENTSLKVTFNSNWSTTNFEINDITVTNGELSDFNTINNATYNAIFTPSGLDIPYTIQVEADKYTNINGIFNQASNIISGFLTTTLSTSTIITQTLLNTYTFPVKIIGGTSIQPVIITFSEDLTIGSSIGNKGYFIIDSPYITINGQSHIVTITDIPDYPGLIQNGTNSILSQADIKIENIGVLSSGITTLLSYGGWVCHQYFGYFIRTGKIIIQNCYSNGEINFSCGGICGGLSGYRGLGGIFEINNCYSTGKISGSFSGGICGRSCMFSTSNGIYTVQNCYSTGEISGQYSGGICGRAYGGYLIKGIASVQNCYSTGNISNESSGGICGYFFGVGVSGGILTVNNCYSTGNMSGSNGGICGDRVGFQFKGGEIEINNCYSLGNISESSGGIVGPNCGLESTALSLNINNCYTIGTFDIIIDNGIFGPNKIVGTQTNCIASGNNTWDDETSQTILTGSPTSISTNNPGTTWATINTNTPYVLSLYDDELYDPNNASSSLPYTTSQGLFQPEYSYQQVYNSLTNNVSTTSVFVYKGTAPSYYDYNFNTFTFTNTDCSSNLDLYVNPTDGIIYYYNKDIYNVYTITFSEFLESPATQSGTSLYFTYKGESEDDNVIKYVAGSCSLQLVNQKNEIGGSQTWQWETNILQDNIRASLTGTIYTSAGILPTPEFLWNLMLKEQQKTLCTLTLDKNTVNDVSNVLYAVGTTEIISKLYLYITTK